MAQRLAIALLNTRVWGAGRDHSPDRDQPAHPRGCAACARRVCDLLSLLAERAVDYPNSHSGMGATRPAASLHLAAVSPAAPGHCLTAQMPDTFCTFFRTFDALMCDLQRDHCVFSAGMVLRESR
jgi:hypothetical protein